MPTVMTRDVGARDSTSRERCGVFPRQVQTAPDLETIGLNAAAEIYTIYDTIQGD